jgi:hypothetical protein
LSDEEKARQQFEDSSYKKEYNEAKFFEKIRLIL